MWSLGTRSTFTGVESRGLISILPLFYHLKIIVLASFSLGGGDMEIKVTLWVLEEERKACLRGNWLLTLQQSLFREDGGVTM